MKDKKKIKMPGAVVILFILLIAMSLLSYIIPAGQFERVEAESGRMMVVADSFKFVENNPISLLDFFASIPQGFVNSSNVIVFNFIIAGAFSVLEKIGLINTMVEVLSNKYSNNGNTLIAILMVVFGLIAAFVGTPELCMVYVPIILPLIVSLGYNPMIAVAVPLVGTIVGFTAAFTNPFTVGISHQITGLPMFSGMWLRIIMFVVYIIAGCLYVINYAKKIKVEPELAINNAKSLGLVSEDLKVNRDGETVKLTRIQKIIGLFFVLSFAYMIYGVLTKGWGMIEMAGIFLAIGIISGIVGRLDSSQIVDAFLKGMKSVLTGVVLIGVATAVSVILNKSMIMDTIVYYLSDGLRYLPASLTSIGILFLITIFNFLVPSGSGKALALMPILSPIAEIIGVNQQVAVLAYQIGDGLTNVFWPTSGYFMATLEIAKIEYSEWVKFFSKLLSIMILMGLVFLLVAQAINYGPF
ncbi:YfcC family protein [Anaerococcus urinomassiliensis]|uniref:YfcC family protein n=1 Tax=Anaerococcus urinomassiliensis TaxID=1745712 RepID=UPI000939755B|nr:AbgT family transporter [Anaerococcus urinomassiliensis]